MKISTRSRYGLRSMVYLGSKYGQGLISLKEIAKHEYISEKYLEQIAIILKSAGLIISERGNSGGYQLAKDPKKITLKNIIGPLEGGFLLVECKNNNKKCTLNKQCVTIDIWHDIETMISDYLKNITLKHLVESYKRKNNSYEYHI